MENIGTRRKTASGFGRTDLIAVLATISVLMSLTMAGISANRGANPNAECMENLRALTRAWQQFDVDHSYLPPNPDDGNTTPGFNWVPGQAGRGGAHEFNPDILTDQTRSLLFPYLPEKNANVFRCPEDTRQGTYKGSDPLKRGTIVFAARSYAMNVAIGSNPYAKLAGTPTDGAWLDNNHSHIRNKPWRTYGKLDDIVDPSPSHLAVLLDEDADSINDGTFAFGMAREEWIDWPGSRHGTGAVMSFADGRAELQRWVDPRTVVQNHRVQRLSVPGSADYRRLRNQISAPKALTRPLIVVRSAGVPLAEVKLVWPAKLGFNNRVEFSDDLISWKPLGAPVQISGDEASATDPAPSTVRRYYRFVAN